MVKYVNRESLAQALSNDLNITKKDAMQALSIIFDEMSEALAQGGKVDISSFGKFEIFYRKERMGINPNTKEKVLVAASNVPKFKPSQTLKKKCNR